jgi:hypothetical protein
VTAIKTRAMTDPDRLKLLFGPYKAPPRRR